MDRLPEVAGVVIRDAVEIDHVGVPSGLIADDAGRLVPSDIDREGEAIADRLRTCGRSAGGIDETDFLVQAPQRGIAKTRRAAADAQLHEARAGPHQDAKGPGRDLGKERTFVALAYSVELRTVIGNYPGEHIEPPDRALRIGGCRSAPSQ